MKTIGGVIISLIAFVAIWLGSAALTIIFAFQGWGESGIGTYLKLGMAWFICPGIGGYYAPKVAVYFLKDLNLEAVLSSFITTITLIFLFMVFFSYMGGEVSTFKLLQFTLQFCSFLIGALLSKSAIKEKYS